MEPVFRALMLARAVEIREQCQQLLVGRQDLQEPLLQLQPQAQAHQPPHQLPQPHQEPKQFTPISSLSQIHPQPLPLLQPLLNLPLQPLLSLLPPPILIQGVQPTTPQQIYALNVQTATINRPLAPHLSAF